MTQVEALGGVEELERQLAECKRELEDKRIYSEELYAHHANAVEHGDALDKALLECQARNTTVRRER